ncbi:Hint domain-containing protein [Maritimibacter fusiformis]|uniref:Type I secretion protein n=1 Tax=Maritimibacter fusiformis TaxID=2603819 RepID=A0A5D0RLB7_9RHOB|nr:Hint domain-containing protein [Maritimibacter fusiformis]TYB81746.1 type I secretion protein [Maritimibacter fusiformis]
MTTWTPTGNYILDWDLTGADGSATLSSTGSGPDVLVSVATPANVDGDEFTVVGGQLFSKDVGNETKGEISFGHPVTDVNFQLVDVDQGWDWDDKVTIRAYDAQNNLVDVTFTDLQTGQVVTGNSIEGNDALNDEGVTVSIAGPIVKLVIVHDNGSDEPLSGHIKVTDLGFNCPDGQGEGDGIVQGTAGDDVIDIYYTGDPHGDMVDNNDAILPGEAPNDDIILGFAGDDRIDAGEGDDEVYAGSGNDTVFGGTGDDEIHGDSNGGYGGGTTTVRESLNWDEAPGFAHNANADGFTQNTGNVEVTFSIVQETGKAASKFETDDQYVDGIEDDGQPVDQNSSLFSTLRGEGNEGDYTLDFSEAVSNVSFRVNDIDGDGVVRISAFDENGDPIEVELDGGSRLTLLDTDGVPGADTADSKGGYKSDADPRYSMLVTIPGPVSQILIEHDQDGSNGSGINITDVYFDVMVDAGAGEPGNDVLHGGEGDDLIYGEGGNDTIIGGDGSDTVYGGDGDDVIDTSGSTPMSDYGADLPDPWPDIPEDYDKFNDRDFVDGGAGNDTISTGDDQDVIFGGDGDDTIDGGLDDDTIDGGDGNDVIIGGHGSDTIYGGAGNDEIWGGLGAGSDPLNIQDKDDPVYGIDDPRPDNGIDIIHGGDGDDVIYGQDDADILYGDDGNDFIDGGIDNDEIYGGKGDDILYGGQGDDLIDGGEGADRAFGGDDQDTFVNVGPGDYVDGNEGGVDYDTLDLRGSAPTDGGLRVTYTSPDNEDGFVTFFDKDDNEVGTMDFYNIENVVPCFTPGTRIATPKGEKLVEELKAGDRVITRDNGIQEIRWIGAKPMDWKAVATNPHLNPVLIRAGALGNGLPERDMLVSPNHRILVANDRTALYFDEREVLAAAKHLVDNRGIEVVEPAGVTYIHFMFDHHEVVLSDGAWTESFQPGDHSLKGIGNAQRQELFELFPELETREGIEDYAAARRILKKHEARMLVGE